MSVSAGLGDLFSAELTSDELEYVHQSHDADEERVSIRPDAARWRSFRRSVERLKGWPWEGHFEHASRTDGISWEVELVWADGNRACCDGYDAFPPDGDGPAPSSSFRSFCRAISRLLDGRPFGWEQASEREQAAAKGSQLRIREWVGDHRERLEAELLAASPTLADWAEPPIKWLAPLTGDEFREPRDDLWPLLGVDPSPQQAGWWPKRGPVWDAVGVVPGRGPGLGIVLVEAKSHEAELRSPSTQASYESLRIIEEAFDETKEVLGVPPSAPWTRTYYQLVNRLALLHWLRNHAGREAWLINLYFLGDRFTSGRTEVIGPADAAGWSAAIGEAKRTLQLPAEHRLSPWTVDLFLPAAPAQPA